MISYKEFRTTTLHDKFMSGDNLSYFVGGYFPKVDFMKILRKGMSIPSDEIMAEAFPTVKQRKGLIPFLTLYSRCNNVREHIWDVTVCPYLEINFFFPVIYTHKGEERLCSFMPLLYLDHLFHTLGGCMLGLRKQFHRNMKFNETDTTCSFDIKNILSASFPKNSMEEVEVEELDPFFAQIFTKPTLTYSYFLATDFYTTQLFNAKKVYKAAADIEWNFKGTVIKSDEHTFCNFADYSFTCSRAMSYKKYFHPKYPVDWKKIAEHLPSESL